MSYQPQNLRKHVPWHRDLGHLEYDVAGMRDDLGTDLHELFPERGQRPVRDSFGQCQRPHEVGEVVGECMKLKADGIGDERAARQSCPLYGVLAFLDSLLAGAALIVESDDALGWA